MMAQWDGRRLNDKRFHGGVCKTYAPKLFPVIGDKEETCFVDCLPYPAICGVTQVNEYILRTLQNAA